MAVLVGVGVNVPILTSVEVPEGVWVGLPVAVLVPVTVLLLVALEVLVGVVVFVAVAVRDPVGVIVAVDVLVGVEVEVKVGVRVPHGGNVNTNTRPSLIPPVLHSYCVYAPLPASPSTPTVALMPPSGTGPYTMSNLCCPSYSRTSKLSMVTPSRYPALHSMLNMRSGCAPVTEVNTPHPWQSVTRSSQWANMVAAKSGWGRQELIQALLLLLNCKVPLELTLALV
jgi:hypothetical protein